MTRPPEVPKVIPGSQTLGLLAAEITARHSREWQMALSTVARELNIDLSIYLYDQAQNAWVDQTPAESE